MSPSEEEVRKEDEQGPGEYLEASDMVRILGIPAATFQQWCKRGVMPALLVQHKGRTYRRFTMADAGRAATIGILYRMGFEPGKARELAKLVDEAYYWAVERTPMLPSETVGAHVAVSLQTRKWHVFPPADKITPAEILARLGSDAFVVVDLAAIQRELSAVTLGASRAYRSKAKPKMPPEIDDSP